MRTLEALDFEDFPFDEPLDAIIANELADVLASGDDEEDDQELGYRALLERPEALAPSLRRQLH